MNNLTASLCESLARLDPAQMTTRGNVLAQRIWSRFPAGSVGVAPPQSSGSLVAGTNRNNSIAVEAAAFCNALHFATELSRSPDDELACWAIPVFAATAIADARGLSWAELSHALGLAMEADLRLRRYAPAPSDTPFEWKVLSAIFAAIVACGTLEGLPADKLTLAVGLGGSTITAASGGYRPLQVAMGAQDSLSMVLLIACGFRAPPDVLACRWGMFDVFSGSVGENANRIDRQVEADDPMLRQALGGSAGDVGVNVDASRSVREIVTQHFYH